MQMDKFINAVSRAFWRRIEPYKNDFEKELPEKLPVEFQSFMGTALSWLDDKVLVWNDSEVRPDDNAKCLIEFIDGGHEVAHYCDTVQMFACPYVVPITEIKRWTELESK